MDKKELPQYSQVNPSVNQFVAQPSYGQPVTVQPGISFFI